MKSILITGGTGSLGNAFVRRLLQSDEYERICIFSRDEAKQQQMRITLNDNPRLRWFIGDVRNEVRLTQALDGVDVVVHAAALKIVPLCEYNPGEAVLTNITGSLNLIGAAVECGVKKVVALSSDKACEPINLYGKTKSVMESLITQGNVYSHKTRFACCRYGNVWGSRGSVIPLWEKQLAETGRIQITEPGMTRFFMTIDEACKLVENALRDMSGGEIFVPRIRSMRMDDLARAWYKLDFGLDTEPKVDIVGIRPGEKMNETLVSRHESYRTFDQVNRFVIAPVAREWLSENIQGVPLEVGASYSSNDNPSNVGGIREWLSQL